MHEQMDSFSRPIPGPPPVFQQTEPQLADPRAGIEEAVAGLDELDQLPLFEHVERFDAVHTELTVALSGIDKV